MIIIGNGKSLEGFDFKKIKEETIGLCCAYRYWEKINWFPTYYCCVDHVVIKLDDGTLVIKKTPKDNPNYFFNYYQMQGDIYNKPNGTRIHKASWMDLAHIVILYNQLSRKQVDVINYNTNDTLDKYYQREKEINKILDSK